MCVRDAADEPVKSYSRSLVSNDAIEILRKEFSRRIRALLKKEGRRTRDRAPAMDRIRRHLACIDESTGGEGLAAFRAINLDRSPYRGNDCILMVAQKLIGFNCQKLQPRLVGAREERKAEIGSFRISSKDLHHGFYDVFERHHR